MQISEYLLFQNNAESFSKASFFSKKVFKGCNFDDKFSRIIIIKMLVQECLVCYNCKDLKICRSMLLNAFI